MNSINFEFRKIVKHIILTATAISTSISPFLVQDSAFGRPQYSFAQSPSQSFDFTKANSLNSYWEPYSNKQVFDRFKNIIRYDRADCPDNIKFSSDKGLLLRAYRKTSTINCGAGIRSMNTLQFGKMVIIARVPNEAEVHSSGWLNLGTVIDGKGYREIDIFEHFDNKNTSVSSGVHWGKTIDNLKGSAAIRTGISQSKFHRFELRWTPRRIRVFIGNEDGSNMREARFDKSKLTRPDDFLVNELQAPMKLRLDVNPKDAKINPNRPRIMRIKSIKIYKCLQQDSNGPQKSCEARP